MPNWHKLTECMLKSTVALSYLYSFACLFVGCCHGMFLACWLRSFASAMHCDKQQPQLQPSQHYAHAIAQLCDLYLHTAMLLHALLAVEAQPLMDAATILGTTLWQMITCHSVAPKIIAINSTRRSQFNSLQSIQLAAGQFNLPPQWQVEFYSADHEFMNSSSAE